MAWNPTFDQCQLFWILGSAARKGIDERQITHLICACLKYDLYDVFRGVLGLLPVLFLV